MGMSMFLVKNKRRGFTLVEVLIVVLIIGVLAGLAMITSLSMQNSSKAARIIADMREMKAAAFMYKADKGAWPIWIYSEGNYSNRDSGNTGVLPNNYLDKLPIGEGYWIGVMRHPTIGSIALVAADVSKLDIEVKKAIVLRSDGIPFVGNRNNRKTNSRYLIPV